MSEQPPAGGSNETDASVAIVRQFFADLRAALNGEPINPYRTFSDDVEFVVTGQTPLSGTWRGMKSVMEDFFAQASPLMGRADGQGLFQLEYIAEGRQVAVRARGRG